MASAQVGGLQLQLAPQVGVEGKGGSERKELKVGGDALRASIKCK